MRRIIAKRGIAADDAPAVITLAQAMYNGMEVDKVTYSAPNPPLPVFLPLIQNCAVAQQAALMRTKGAAATRDAECALLFTAVQSEQMYVQALGDASPSRAKALFENVGLGIHASSVYTKALLTLRPGLQSGSITCDANVGLLVGPGAVKPTQSRFFNWEYTLDGGKTFVGMPSTTKGKTGLQNLVPLTMVGVRVNLNIGTGPGPWSQMVTTHFPTVILRAVA